MAYTAFNHIERLLGVDRATTGEDLLHRSPGDAHDHDHDHSLSPPGETHTSEAHSAGTRELLLVLAGRVDLRVGDRTDRLEVGDSAAFAGDVGHGYSTPADAATAARFALTVFQPDVGGGRP